MMQAAGIGYSELVFPEEEWPVRQFRVSGDEKRFEAAKTNSAYLGQFLVTTCVVYKPTFRVDAPYRTAKQYYTGYRTGAPIDLNSVGVISGDLAFNPSRPLGTLAR